MDELVETYGEDRKTRVIERSVDNFSPADLVPHQSSVVTLTRHGYIKRQPVEPSVPSDAAARASRASSARTARPRSKRRTA